MLSLRLAASIRCGSLVARRASSTFLTKSCKASNRFNEDREQLPGVHAAPPKDRIIERCLNISALLSEMFSLVAAHRVYLDSSFTSVVLSVMVLEGFGRSLDPDLDLFQCARPYLLNMV
ncbi:hypothetical protein Aduo_007821 [Ancylostoma duodenale]